MNGRSLAAFLVVLASAAACSTSDDDSSDTGSDDCKTGQALDPKSAALGDPCEIINYGTCTGIDNCLKGACTFDPGGTDSKHCRTPCAATTDCASNETCEADFCQPS
jgi:hypothetical protein